MSVTTTKARTVGDVLALANPNDYDDAVRLAYGAGAEVEEDTGTISAIDHIVLKNKANRVVYVQVVTSGTAGSVGFYAAIPGATPALPAGAGQGGGIATLGTDGKTITFPNTITRAKTRYAPATKLLSENFANS